MSRERRWWGMPKSFGGFALWRLSNPFDSGEVESGDRKSKTPEVEESATGRVERTRSRSSSFSFRSRKSIERTPPREVEEKKEAAGETNNALSDISFTFFGEQDHENDYILVDPNYAREERGASPTASKHSRETSNEWKSASDRSGSDDDDRLKRAKEPEVEKADVRHVSSVQMTVKPVDHGEPSDLKMAVEHFVKDNDYEVLKVREEPPYATPTATASECCPVYATIDKPKRRHSFDVDPERSLSGDISPPCPDRLSEDKTLLDMPPPCPERLSSVDNESLELLSPISERLSNLDKELLELLSPCLERHSSVDKELLVSSPESPVALESLASTLETVSLHETYEDRPEVPQPDWDESGSSGYNPDYAELTTPVATPEPHVDELASGPEVKEEMAYCQHRAELKPAKRRVTLLRCKKTVRRTPSIGKVKNKLGKAWKKVRGWWIEERIRLNEVILKRDSVREASVVSEVVADCRSLSEDDVWSQCRRERLQTDLAPEDLASACSTLPARRRRRRSPTPVLSRSSSIAAFRRSRFFPEGQTGFEELRRHVKLGGDFCKDLGAVLHERSEAELSYSKTLSKLSAKLSKLTKESASTVCTAWQRAAAEMETQAEVHRVFATELSEEIVKPLKQMMESQHRNRKNVETAVDKTGKSLAEWRSAECKAKKQSFASARENEKMQDAMVDVRIAGVQSPTSASTLHLHSKLVSDKENAKMESKRRKAEDSVKRADVEYYTYCIRAERARLEWESAVLRGSHCFQSLEEQRLQQLKELTDSYLHHYREIGPKLTLSASRLEEPVAAVSVVADLEPVAALRESGQPTPEQQLPDFYAEHITLAMNRERRRQGLVKLLQLIRQDLERERRGKQGVENLARALKQTPTFGADDSQQNVSEKLHHMRSMLAYLEAARYKVQSALAELEGRLRESHPLAAHIHVTRDRQGLQQSVLKVPVWVRKDSVADNIEWNDRGTADGNSVQPDSDFDEFSSQGSERDYQSSVLSQFSPDLTLTEQPLNVVNGVNGRCKALYHYAANLYDELNLNPGDVINIHDKQADGWWLGELNGTIGIFPATYVEEIKNDH